MACCQKCLAEVEAADLYDDHGLKVCEDCKIKGTVSPAQPCGGEKQF